MAELFTNDAFLKRRLDKIDLEVLTRMLVPDLFYHDPDSVITATVRSFIHSLQTNLDDINSNFYRLVNLSTLEDVDILKIYHQSYLATLGIDKEEDHTIIESAKLFQYVSELINYKGSTFLTVLLSNLLVTLIPSVRSSIKNIEDQLKDPTLTDEEMDLLQSRINSLIKLYTQNSVVEVLEDDENVFVYRVEGELDFISWMKFVKPFTHPIGWSVKFSNNTITVFREDKIVTGEWLIIDELYDWKQHTFIHNRQFRSDYLTNYDESLISNIPTEFIAEDDNGKYYNYREEFIINQMDPIDEKVVGDYSIYSELDISPKMSILYQTSTGGYVFEVANSNTALKDVDKRVIRWRSDRQDKFDPERQPYTFTAPIPVYYDPDEIPHLDILQQSIDGSFIWEITPNEDLIVEATKTPPYTPLVERVDMNDTSYALYKRVIIKKEIH